MVQTENQQKSCKERIQEHLNGRIEDLTKLWTLYREDCEASDPDLGSFNEYGLSFDYVAPKTFRDQRKGYFRYQLSWGGPSDEFRFYCDENLDPYKIEYWFLDWFDGAPKVLYGKRFDLLAEIFQDFKECGTVQAEYDKARED